MNFLRLLCAMFLVVVISNPSQVMAMQTKQVSSQEVQNGISLQVAKGSGLTINFQQLGEQINQAWISDPTQIVFQIKDGVVFIRQIKPIKFPNITRNKDGSTQLVVLTTSKRGQNQYTFKLVPVERNTQYNGIVLLPKTKNSQPLMPGSPNAYPQI